MVAALRHCSLKRSAIDMRINAMQCIGALHNKEGITAAVMLHVHGR